jgi:hypothetical protein
MQCIEADFNIDFEDDTVVTTISTMIQDLYRKCAAGDLVAARELLVSLEKHPSMQKMQHTNEDDSGDSEDEEGDTESAAGGAGVTSGEKSRGPKRIVDEEGWETIVPTKKGRGDNAKTDEVDAGTSEAMERLSVAEVEPEEAPPAPKTEKEKE